MNQQFGNNLEIGSLFQMRPPKTWKMSRHFDTGTFFKIIFFFWNKTQCCKGQKFWDWQIIEMSQNIVNEPVHEISNNVICVTSKASDQPAHTRSLIRAFASRLSILWLLSYWLDTIWSFLSLKGGCRGSSESTHVKMPHCWKSHATAQMSRDFETGSFLKLTIM